MVIVFSTPLCSLRHDLRYRESEAAQLDKHDSLGLGTASSHSNSLLNDLDAAASNKYQGANST